jgi:protein dithiol oxidoreductase (disulfide-forming)
MMINRRDLQQLALLLAAAAARPSPAQAASHRELRQSAPVEAPPARIEVVDFFWYGCPHCNAFEPMLSAWVSRAPADVSVRHVPVSFQPAFGVHQRLYFTLEAMGLLGDLHRRVFHAIHTERRRLTSEAAIVEWARAQPRVDGDRFANLFGSFGIANKVSRATQLQDAYGVTGVPALGVAGRWLTDGAMAGDMSRALAEVDRLIEQARRTQRR